MINFMIDWPIFDLESIETAKLWQRSSSFFPHFAINWSFDKFGTLKKCLSNCVKSTKFCCINDKDFQLLWAHSIIANCLAAIIVHYFIVLNVLKWQTIMNALCANLSNQMNVRTHISPIWTKIQQWATKSVQLLTCANRAIPILKWNLVESLFSEILRRLNWILLKSHREWSAMRWNEWRSMVLDAFFSQRK